MAVLSKYGWICPKCQTVNAPWKSTCDCNSKPVERCSGSTSQVCKSVKGDNYGRTE